MWERVLDRMLGRLIVTGTLRVTFPDGIERRYGAGAPETALRITTNARIRQLCLSPELSLGEGYMDATLVPEDLDTLLHILMINRRPERFPAWIRMADRIRYGLNNLRTRNSARRARSNVAHHYDISDDLYRLFLDEDMQYSCAYFERADMTLEEAQAAKKAHIAKKLRIEPGMRVLDIGCGWGGMAMTLARDFGAEVVGVTLSDNQLATATARVRAAGLEDRVEFRLQDYRHVDERFDRIVSVGMLEHVGVPHYPEYFAQVANLLDPDGVALIHTIGRCEVPMGASRWIGKYIFPGGYVPALSDLSGPIEQSELWLLDLEVLRLHYARTLHHWLDRFTANLDEVRKSYDETFIRMWTFYLLASAASFETGRQAVFQFQLAHDRTAVPLTRDYLYVPPASGDEKTSAAE